MQNKTRIAAAITIIILLLSSCTEKEAELNFDNDFAPPVISSELMLSEFTIGSSSKETEFHQLIQSEGDFFFRGILDNCNVVGKISGHGGIIWKSETDFIPNDIILKQDYLVVCGGKDTDGDDINNVGCIAHFNTKNGDLVASPYIVDKYPNISFYGINSEAVFGHCEIDEIIYPYILHYYLATPQMLLEMGDSVYTNLENHVFYQTSGDYVLGKSFTGTRVEQETREAYIHKLKTGNALSKKIEWTCQIENPDYTLINGISILHDSINRLIYVCGELKNTNDFTKAFLAAVSTEGVVKYVNIPEQSVYASAFTGLVTNGSYLYISGVYDYKVYKNIPEPYIGYGSISKLDAISGTLISNKVFGNDDYCSGINSIINKDNSFFTLGWTNWSHDNDKNGWFMEIERF